MPVERNAMVDGKVIYVFIYLFCFAWELRIYIYKKKNIDDNYKTRQGHHNSKNQLLWAQVIEYLL